MIPTYPRHHHQPSPEEEQNYLVLLYPGNSETPLIQCKKSTREMAEKAIRSWLELQPEGKGEIIYIKEEDKD